MVSMAILGWILSGIVGFLVNLGKTIRFAEEIFGTVEVVAKWVYYILVFIIHMVGGLISFGWVVYNKLKGR